MAEQLTVDQSREAAWNVVANSIHSDHSDALKVNGPDDGSRSKDCASNDAGSYGKDQTLPKGKVDYEKKIGHRRVGATGQVTYKKIETSQICGSIQLGIGNAIASLASKPERDLLMQDFAMIETTNFVKEGSKTTPAHHYSDYKFKSYAPVAFRYFRDLFGIRPEDFLLSFCSEPLRELTNPGASGSVFYLTFDDEFIIKTVQHKEAEFLQKLLPGYYMNLNQNPRTLLPKFFGLYCYICGGKNVRVCVMNNLLPTSIKMHEKYDLKGSTYKRKANKYEKSKSSPTYKDLDFMEIHPEGISLEPVTYDALIKTMQRDCRVLESFKIMDYSLLIGVHNLDQAAREKMAEKKGGNSTTDQDQDPSTCQPHRTFSSDSDGAINCDDNDDTTKASSNLARSKSINKARLAAYSTAMESIQAEAEPIDEEDDVPPGGIPARNAKGERLLLFLGIIDILQSYRLKKKVEHTLKSMLTDGDTVSVHRPSFYAQRFLDFMAKTVFKKIPSLDLPEIKGPHRKFRTLVSSFMALKHSPSKRKMPLRVRPPSNSDSANSEQAVKAGVSNEGGSGSAGRVQAEGGAPVVKDAGISSTSATAQSSLANAPLSTNSQVNKKQVRTSENLRTVVIKRTASNKKSVVNVSDKGEIVSVSQVNLNTDSIGSVTSSSSGFSSALGGRSGINWTPAHSIAGSTPTHTEGTPSLTESSESEIAVCPTTPLRSHTRTHIRRVSEGGDDVEMSETPSSPTVAACVVVNEPNALVAIAEDVEQLQVTSSSSSE